MKKSYLTIKRIEGKSLILRRRWQMSLVLAITVVVFAGIPGGRTLMRESAAQEYDSAVPGATTNFANTTPISIPASGTVGNSAPYPSNIVVAGLTSNVAGVTVKLNNFNHTYPDDVDLLLVGPGGQNAIIMSDVGGAPDAVGLTLTLNDAALNNLPDTAGLTNGTFKPTNITDGPDTFPAPAPAPSGGSALSVFNGTNPNGTWSLYIVDDSNLDAGTLNGGWELNITTAAPAPGQLQFSASNYNGVVPNTATVTVNRVNGSSGAVTVDYATANGSATGGASCGAGVDYISANGTLSFADGESSKTFTVQLCPDPAPDPTETVNLTLSNPTGGATLGTPGTATLTIYTPGSTPCDVTWRTVDNPHIISGTVTIPANQNVCIEPGVIVQWADNSQLNLFGRLTGAGTTFQPIRFLHANVGPNKIEVAGILDLSFADIGIILNSNSGSSIICRDCNFNLYGSIVTLFGGISTSPGARFVQVESSVFDGQNVEFSGAGLTAIVRNVTVRNGAFLFLGSSYLYLDNITSQNSTSAGLAFRQSVYQPTFLNNLNITNSTGAGLSLGNGNFEIGPNVVLQNNEYPVEGKGGLMPGSNVPASGNRNNWFEVGQANAGGSIYSQIAVPYVVDSFSDIGSLEILPGAHFKARPNFSFNTESGPIHALGLPGAPITIEPFIAGQKWHGGQFNFSGNRMEYVVLDGIQNGITAPATTGGDYYIDNSIVRNSELGIITRGPTAFLQGNIFTNNTRAIYAFDYGVKASGRTNPNLFENNATAVYAESGTLPDVRYNWWNSPTGPTNPQNPGGTGDLITGIAYFQPFRLTRPDTTDRPPIVRMPHVPHPSSANQGMIEAENKIVLNWQASDDRQIVKQKILYSPAGNARNSFHIIADNLPPTQREYELLVPATGFEVSGSKVYVRVVAIDDKGQEGWDEWQATTPAEQETGVLQITSNVAGQTFRGGQAVPLTWTVTAPFQNTDFVGYILLDADRQLISVGGGQNGQTFLPPKMPLVSTDSARFAVRVAGTANRQKWFFSAPFSIRPDSRYIDAPPQITLTSPTAGQEFPAGSIVPITWTASDDEALRQFNIQVSTDGGRTWILIADNLPPATTNYNWQTPFGGGANDVRIRVIAVDRRFQNSSDGATRAFRLTSPPNAAPGVQLTFPANGASYTIGQAFFVAADASDSDGTIRRVEFYETTSQFAPLNTKFIGADTTPPYQIGWTYPNAQTHTITARVIDNRNAATTSAPVNVTVQPVPLAPLSIGLPELTNPRDGETFNPGQNVTLNALPAPSSYSTVRIEFYNGTTLLASDNTAPYEIVWNNVPAGRYTVFAKTIAGNGAEAISKPADISVGISQQRTPFDFDGDGRADVSVFRPSDRVWYLLNSSSGFSAAQFGLASDKITPADYDGDGKTDIAVFRDGVWYWINSLNGSIGIVQFGVAGDIPVPADFNGDGRAELAVYRLGVWWTLNLANNQSSAVQFGISTDKPVPADYDGDGKTDYAVFRDGVWHLLRSSDNGYRVVQFGLASDTPTTADYDGDGKSDQAVYRGGVWYILGSSQGFYAFQFGISSDTPTPADYDGDRKANAAVFRDGVWYYLNNSNNTVIVQFGLSGDAPVPAAFVR